MATDQHVVDLDAEGELMPDEWGVMAVVGEDELPRLSEGDGNYPHAATSTRRHLCGTRCQRLAQVQTPQVGQRRVVACARVAS